MKLRQYILALLFLFTFSPFHLLKAQENDEVGIWSELGIEKAITKKWDVGLGLEYRAQNKSRFSAGLSTSYKLNKYLKLGIGYNFLYSYRSDKYKDKSEGEVGSDEWTIGYNHTPEYWFPRHRFSAEATGSIKLWKWLKISLRERYQLTYCKARTVSKFKYRDEYVNQPKWVSTIVYGSTYDPNDPFTWFDYEIVNTQVSDVTHEHIEEWVSEEKPAYTDQVLRSRIKFEYDKKRCPFSPFVSAEFHNSISVGDHMLLQKIRTAIGSSYKFRKHNEVTLSYILTFDMYDIEDNEVVRLHDRMHAINIGYTYSF